MEKVRPSLIPSATNLWTAKFKGKEKNVKIDFLSIRIFIFKSIIM